MGHHHDHCHEHSHGHDHGVSGDNPRLGLAIGLTMAFVLGEAFAGSVSGSLALVSDAGHNLSDALALFFAWWAIRAAKKPASPERTFGSHRVGILAALGNALTLVAVGAIILWEAVHRFIAPAPVEGGPMIWVALIAIVLNGTISIWLRQGAKDDLNLRGAYIHMLGDAASAAGVVVAGVIVRETGSTLADPVASVLIGVFIIWSSWGILTEAINVLLEATPKGIDMALLEQSIKAVPGAREIHDLHVWTVASGIVAASFHLLVSDQSVTSGEQIVRAVAAMLQHDFGIGHSTIQIEVEGCAAEGIYCSIERPPAS